MEMSESGFARATAREAAVLAVAGLGAYLFFIHGSLYLQPGSAARPVTVEGFLLVTAILYLFLRLIFVVASLYYPRSRPAPTVCEACGQELKEASARETAQHYRIRPSRKPTEKEVLAAVMLRKAIDDARRLSRKDLAGARPDDLRILGEVENAPVPPEEFERILRQLDAPRNARDPDDRHPKGPG